MKRRNLLATTMFVAGAFTLNACGTIVPTQVGTYATQIADGFVATVQAVEIAVPGVASTTLDQIEGFAKTVGQDASKLASTVASLTADPKTIVTEISNVVTQAAPILEGLLPKGSAAISMVAAVVSLLPSLLGAAGVTLVGGIPPKMNADQAKAILAGASPRPARYR